MRKSRRDFDLEPHEYRVTKDAGRNPPINWRRLFVLIGVLGFAYFYYSVLDAMLRPPLTAGVRFLLSGF